MTRSNEATPNQDSAGSRVHWPSWIVGATILAAVVGVGMHISEGREFLVHAEQAAPWWLLLALILQASTYLAQGEVFRGARRAAGCKVPLGAVYELSLAKLLVDQALPSAGISSTVLVAKALERRAVPRGVVAASMVINIASYHAAYVVCLLIALAITVLGGSDEFARSVRVRHLRGVQHRVDRWAAGGVRPGCPPPWCEAAAISCLEERMAFLKDADPRLAWSRRLQGEGTAWRVSGSRGE